MGGKVLEFIKSILRALRTGLKTVKAWQLFLILIPLLFIAATLLRFDHITMTELKDAVLQADEDGDATVLQEKMQELKDFTNSHIVVNIVEKNGVQEVTFGSGGFYLENTYKRDAEAAVTAAEAELSKVSSTNPNGNVFAKAMDVCKPQAIKNGWSWNSQAYLNCMTGEIAKYPTTDALVTSYTAAVPSTALYRYDFASPVWAPTFSGWIILLCVILTTWIIAKIIIWLLLKIALLILK